MVKTTSEMVTAALLDGDVDKASALMYAEAHNQLHDARTQVMSVPALLDEVSEGVLSACLVEPPAGYSQREKALARLVARLAMHPFAESAAMIGR
jgi:hypothetical protein